MKRREFVVKSGLATAAMGTSTMALGKVFAHGKNDTLRIGIIGTGDRGSGLIPFLNQIDRIRSGGLLRHTAVPIGKSTSKRGGWKCRGIQRLPQNAGKQRS